DVGQLLGAMRRQTSRATVQVRSTRVDLSGAVKPESIDTASAQTAAGMTLEDPFVTMDQAASMVNRGKKTVERYLNDPKYQKRRPPPPDVEGGGGKPHEWRWSVIRPWLESEFGRKLPEHYPGRNPN